MDNTIVASSAIIIGVLALAGILNAFILDTGPEHLLPGLDDRSSSSSYRGGKTRRSKKI